MGLDILHGVSTASSIAMPMAYIIADCDPYSLDYRFSQRNLKRTQYQADLHGWNTQIWPAVNGHKVTAADWQKIGVEMLDRGAMPKRHGAQGCWHSHWSLWSHCVDIDQPIIVLEHDAYINDEWPQDIDLYTCVWKLYRPDGRGERLNSVTGQWSCGSWAYTLTPQFARQLIDFSRANGAQAVDKQLGKSAIPWQYWSSDLVTHSPDVQISSTARKTR